MIVQFKCRNVDIHVDSKYELLYQLVESRVGVEISCRLFHSKLVSNQLSFNFLDIMMFVRGLQYSLFCRFQFQVHLR